MSCSMHTDGQTATDGGFIVMMGHFEAKFYDELDADTVGMDEVIGMIRKGLIAMGYSPDLVDQYINLEDY